MLLSFVVVPLALIGLGSEARRLPRWARWWETYDNDINGDAPWAGPEHANGKQTTYYWRLRWLLRNRIGVFSHEMTGLDRGEVDYYSARGDLYTGNIPGHSGGLYAEAHLKSGRIYPCYYWVYQWGNSDRCLRMYFGWKFRQSRPLVEWQKSGFTSFVFHINPFQRFAR